MTYEYSSEAKLDFPNPYRLENIFWSCRAATLLICAIALLFLARKHLAAQAMGSFVVPVALGVLLFVLAAWNFMQIAKQLKVFFGRGQPAGLAAELSSDQLGVSDQAMALGQTIRQGALEFAIPSGSMNGVLYSLVHNLITAPAYVQQALQSRFANLASYGFLLLIMMVAMLFAYGSAIAAWVGAFFLGLVVFMAVKPVSGGDARATVSFNLTQVLLLVMAAILGPVLLTMISSKLPDLSWASFGMQALLILAALVLIEVVFFVAVQRNIDEPPAVSKVDTQVSVSFNSDPNLLMQELDREMQRNWSQRIPNRRYARILPMVPLNERAGNFKGMLMEESQPMVPSAFTKMDWATAMAYPRFFWLAVIDILGVLMTLLGSAALVFFAMQFNPQGDWKPVMGYATLGLSLVAVGGYAFRSAHTLWGRFDFESKLTWVEMEGSFIRSKIDLGNRLQDRVFTERDVVNVENMTLRVWVTQLRSVVFGHQSHGSATQRIITGMLGLPQDAQYIKNSIAQFAAQQSIVVAPSAAEDARRMAGMGMMNKLGDATNASAALTQAAVSDLVVQAATGSGFSAAPAGNSHVFCRACGTKNARDAAFCEGCGAAV